MRRHVVCTSDLCDSSVRCHDDDRSLVTFKCSVQEGEALDVKHVNLINEKNTWDDFSAALFSPFCDFLVNLFSYFGLNFTDVTSEECHKALSA